MVSPNLLDSTNAGLNARFYNKTKYGRDENNNEIEIGEVEYVCITKNLTNQIIWDGKASDKHKRDFYIEYQGFKGNTSHEHEEALDFKNIEIDRGTIEILQKRQIKNIRQLAAVPTEQAHRLGTRGQEMVMIAKKYMEQLKVKLQVLEVTQEKDKTIEQLMKRIEALESASKPKKKVKNDLIDDSTELS